MYHSSVVINLILQVEQWKCLFYVNNVLGEVCSKTCFVGLLIRSIFLGKNCMSASVRVQFFQRKSNELTDQQDMFCFNHASAFLTSNNIEKNAD